MEKLRVHHDREGSTLIVWFDDPENLGQNHEQEVTETTEKDTSLSPPRPRNRGVATALHRRKESLP